MLSRPYYSQVIISASLHGYSGYSLFECDQTLPSSCVINRPKSIKGNAMEGGGQNAQLYLTLWVPYLNWVLSFVTSVPLFQWAFWPNVFQTTLWSKILYPPLSIRMIKNHDLHSVWFFCFGLIILFIETKRDYIRLFRPNLSPSRKAKTQLMIEEIGWGSKFISKVAHDQESLKFWRYNV